MTSLREEFPWWRLERWVGTPPDGWTSANGLFVGRLVTAAGPFTGCIGYLAPKVVAVVLKPQPWMHVRMFARRLLGWLPLRNPCVTAQQFAWTAVEEIERRWKKAGMPSSSGSATVLDTDAAIVKAARDAAGARSGSDAGRVGIWAIDALLESGLAASAARRAPIPAPENVRTMPAAPVIALRAAPRLVLPRIDSRLIPR